jgi:integrase/recombinase XerD
MVLNNFEDFEEVKKWLSTVKERSKNSYLSGFRLYIDFRGKDPKELIDEIEEDREKSRRERGKTEQKLEEFYQYLLNDFVTRREVNGKQKKGLSKNLAAMYTTSIRSFYRRNGYPLMSKSKRGVSKKENRKLSMTSKLVKRLVDHATTLRDKAIILFMFQGGFDVSTLSSIDYGDVARELKEGEDPMMITVVREKEEVEYFTFVGKDAIDVIMAYLDERKHKGEEITYQSPLFLKEGKKKRKGERITTNLVQNMLRDVAVSSGVVSEEEMISADMNPARPHTLRAGFSTVLRLNGFSDMLVEFMLGHSVPYNGAYLIPPPEKIREMYRDVEPQLSVNEATKSVSDLEKRMDDKMKIHMEMLEEQQKEIRELRDELNKTKGLLTFIEANGMEEKVNRLYELIELVDEPKMRETVEK